MKNILSGNYLRPDSRNGSTNGSGLDGQAFAPAGYSPGSSFNIGAQPTAAAQMNSMPRRNMLNAAMWASAHEEVQQPLLMPGGARSAIDPQMMSPQMAALMLQQRPFSYADAEAAHRQSQLLAMNNLRGGAPQDVNNNNNLNLNLNPNPLMERSFHSMSNAPYASTAIVPDGIGVAMRPMPQVGVVTPMSYATSPSGVRMLVAGAHMPLHALVENERDQRDASPYYLPPQAQVGLPTYPAPHEMLYASMGAGAMVPLMSPRAHVPMRLNGGEAIPNVYATPQMMFLAQQQQQMMARRAQSASRASLPHAHRHATPVAASIRDRDSEPPAATSAEPPAEAEGNGAKRSGRSFFRDLLHPKKRKRESASARRSEPPAGTTSGREQLPSEPLLAQQPPLQQPPIELAEWGNGNGGVYGAPGLLPLSLHAYDPRIQPLLVNQLGIGMMSFAGPSGSGGTLAMSGMGAGVGVGAGVGSGPGRRVGTVQPMPLNVAPNAATPSSYQRATAKPGGELSDAGSCVDGVPQLPIFECSNIRACPLSLSLSLLYSYSVNAYVRLPVPVLYVVELMLCHQQAERC